MVRVDWPRPLPWQTGHGSSTMSPRPRQSRQGSANAKPPALRLVWPVPWQVGQTRGVVPALAPVPWQAGHAASLVRGQTTINSAIARLIGDPQGREIKHADVIIEAIAEKLEIKQKLFADLETKLKPGAVLATNTSSLKIEDVARSLRDPGRLVGIHFFNPVAALPLVEVVRGEKTREDEVKKATAFVTAIKKLPLIVKSCPGFLVNRVLDALHDGRRPPLRRRHRRATRSNHGRDQVRHADGPARIHGPCRPRHRQHVGESSAPAPGKDNPLSRLVRPASSARRPARASTLGQGQAEARTDELRPAELDALGRDLVKPMLDECERALADHRGQRRSRRCRRDFRHRLRAVPRRTAALSP